MKYYQFLYYNLVKLWIRKKDEVANAPINGIITITFLVSLNIISIPLIIMAIFGTTSIEIPNINKWTIVGIFFLFGILNYMILMKNGRSTTIIKKFENIDYNKLKIGFRFTIIYLIISILIPVTIFFIFPPR